MSTVEAIADWAADLSPGDVPPPVWELCRAQRRSVLGAVAASGADGATRRVLAAVEGWAGGGPAPLLGTARRVAVEDAVYGAAARSIALDFDDYVCFGHTGHSAVLVPLLLAAETGATGAHQVVAQVVANEVEARLGGACLIGPQNGQLWSFIHAAGAALAAGRLLGLDRGRLAQALAIALYQPVRSTVPGFMRPDSKLLTAAEPAVAGVRAARLAAAGVTGPADALDHPEGFLTAFADAPLPGLLAGLGHAWATTTLCVKPYPGCAYVDTTVDALLELGPPPADEVERVVVEASALTTLMDELSRPYAGASPPTPVTVNFSVGWNVAITLAAGRLTPDEVHDGWLEAHGAELARLTDRVEVHHDWDLTAAATRQFSRVLPTRALAGDAGLAGLRRAARRLRARQPGGLPAARDLWGVTALLRSPAAAARSRRFWDPDALRSFAMTFPARVRVRLRDGRELVARVDVPRGGAGHATQGPDAVSRVKLRDWGPALWGDAGTGAIAAAIDTDDDRLPELLARAVALHT